MKKILKNCYKTDLKLIYFSSLALSNYNPICIKKHLL